MNARLLAVLVLSVACARRTPQWQARNDERRAALATIHVSDGIDRAEATTIATLYLDAHVTDCGAVDGASLHDGVWVVGLRMGATGRRSNQTIKVDAATGGVWTPGQRRYSDFAELRTELSQ